MILRALFATLALVVACPAGAVPVQDMQSDCRAEAARRYNVIFRRVSFDRQSLTVQGSIVVAIIDFGTPDAKRVRCDYDLFGTLIGVRDAPPNMVVW